MDPNVKAALKAHKDSSLEIIRAVREAYPVGSVLHVTIRRSTFPVQVDDHNEWWDNPGEMVGTNLHTGKTRRFMPDDIIDVNGQPLSSTTDTENDTADIYKQRLKDKIIVLERIADTQSGQMALQLEEVLSGGQRYADPDGSVYFPDEVVEQYGQLVSHDLRQPVEPIYSVTEDTSNE